MSHLPLPIHLAAVGLWLGCALAEALFEHALLPGDGQQRLLLARLHQRADFPVEIPAFCVAAATRAAMLLRSPPSPILHVKVAIGALAIAANLYCAHLVLRRLAFAEAAEWSSFEVVDHMQHQLGAVVFLGIAAALALGLCIHAGAQPLRQGDVLLQAAPHVER